MTTSRMNSNGKNAHVLARRIERQSAVDTRNEAVVARALREGRDHAHILHPTKGFRRARLDKPRKFSGLMDWWNRTMRQPDQKEEAD